MIKIHELWKSSNCIIKSLIKFIPPMSHYSWTKESKSLNKKLIKRNLKNVKEVKEDYWINSPTNNGIKALRYNNNKFSDTKYLFRLSYDKPHLNLGINWILRIRADYEKNARIAIASNRVTDNCPRHCSCCGAGNQSFQHWTIGGTLAFNELQIDDEGTKTFKRTTLQFFWVFCSIYVGFSGIPY